MVTQFILLPVSRGLGCGPGFYPADADLQAESLHDNAKADCRERPMPGTRERLRSRQKVGHHGLKSETFPDKVRHLIQSCTVLHGLHDAMNIRPVVDVPVERCCGIVGSGARVDLSP
jgi:hypothetical protein